MGSLTLELFMDTTGDAEARRYHILDGLQRVRHDFSQNRIYPTLGNLIELYTNLRRIAQQTNEMPKRITGLDLESRRVVYEYLQMPNSNVGEVAELIEWALPHIQTAIEEGQTIFNFVDDHIKVAGIGIVPSYVEEGYLLVPELRAGLLHVIRYEVTIFTGADQRYRNLKTTSVKTMPIDMVANTPWSIKHELILENRELPNPATYFFETDLDFPFNETILPVAKRKFLRQIYS